ncbi:SNF2 family N-terminal domain-containing protein [Bisporella sp. PMI_857]|nr:SNF2 family N-terminal domain-containing protein [Bisporella sp. PMI_857]
MEEQPISPYGAWASEERPYKKRRVDTPLPLLSSPNQLHDSNFDFTTDPPPTSLVQDILAQNISQDEFSLDDSYSYVLSENSEPDVCELDTSESRRVHATEAQATDGSLDDTASRERNTQGASLPTDRGEEICVGMLSDIPLTITHRQFLFADSSCNKLSFSSPNKVYQSPTFNLLGELQERIAKIICNLLEQGGVQIQIYKKSVQKRAKADKKNKRLLSQQISDLQYLLNINIYVPVHLVDDIGRYLAQCCLCLQDPEGCDRDVVYLNPHLLLRTDERVMTSSFDGQVPVDDVVQVIALENIFLELSADDHLHTTEAPDIVTTQLYTHQKKALTFMINRENGWKYDGSDKDFWAKEVDETGCLTYTNMITGYPQKSQPPSTKGGLLADQMGLGKSLTMISLIALNTCDRVEPITFLPNGGIVRCLTSSLVVVPYPLLKTWDTQLNRHLRANTLSWMIFHGSRKKKSLSIARYDIVVTTFETLIGQQKKHNDPKHVGNTLYNFWWHRVILDEAHMIRNRMTSMAKAACALHATNRWVVTGTPIQNRADDFASLLEFLQMYPFSDPKIFHNEIVKPWFKSDEKDITRMRRLIKCISLCRNKSIIDLPKRNDEVQYLHLSSEEREFYDAAKDRAVGMFDDALSSNPLKPKQYLNALQWLNELRLICNHGLAHTKRRGGKKIPNIEPQEMQNWNKKTATKAFETIYCAGQAVCSICGNILTDGSVRGSISDFPKPFLSQCLTLICAPCKKDNPSSRETPLCQHRPVCKSIEVSWTHETDVVATAEPSDLKPPPVISNDQVSTKLKTLLRSIIDGSDQKSVVFSYWTYTLDLIESLFHQASIRYTRIDGQNSGKNRDMAIQSFQSDASIQVILVSITCGGAGLDLTAASRAYLMEPQWNPMTEEQALSRIHRLGQKKEVKTIRYLVRGSFEEQVVATQELKRTIAAEAFTTNEKRAAGDEFARLRHLRSLLN